MAARRRELIDAGTDKRFGRSVADDRRRRSKTVAKPGQAHKGDRARTKSVPAGTFGTKDPVRARMWRLALHDLLA
jgi:hypothetical protein